MCLDCSNYGSIVINVCLNSHVSLLLQINKFPQMNFIHVNGFLCINLICYSSNTLECIKEMINHCFIIEITMNKDVK